MAMTQNPFVYVIALIVTGIFSFLGFRGPAWARAAVGPKHEGMVAVTPESSPALARAIAAAGPNAKVRGTGAKKKPARAAGKKVASNKTARERTESLRSSL